MKTLVILGAGTGGTAMAWRLRRSLSAREWDIVVVDRDDVHVYQPGLLFIPFGMDLAEDDIRSRRKLLPEGVKLRLCGADHIDPDTRQIRLGDGETLHYDLLIVATGTRIAPEATPGLTDPGWYQHAFDFYTLDGAKGLRDALEDFRGGKLVINIAELPIKCPVAPMEFAFLADAFFQQRGLRPDVEVIYVTPLAGAFTRPVAARTLGDMLAQRNISVVPDFALASADHAAKTITSYDGRSVDYDLLVSVPLHYGAEVIQRSGLGDAGGFLPTDPHTLQSRRHENVFSLGDATDLPTSKAGSVAHFQSEVLIENVQRFIAGRSPLPSFDGHANCFIETGHGKAMLLDFNYAVEPLPGRFPLPGVGPFSLLEESYVNHWGKRAFRWVYWNLLLRGEDLPLDHRMMQAGKWSA